jgi:hypothetical protein
LNLSVANQIYQGIDGSQYARTLMASVSDSVRQYYHNMFRLPAPSSLPPPQPSNQTQSDKVKRGRKKKSDEPAFTADTIPAQPQSLTLPAAPDPRALLNEAWLSVSSMQPHPPTGATTACVLVVDAINRELVAANLGDSGFIVIRRQNQSAMNSQSSTHSSSSTSSSYSLGSIGSDGDALNYRGYTIAYASPQQLVYFNCPFQLGKSDSDSFDWLDRLCH